MAAGNKKTVNRKLAYVALAGVGVLGVLALIAVAAKDPAGQRMAREEAAKAAELKAMPTGSVDAGKARVDEQMVSVERDQRRAQEKAQEGFDEFVGGNQQAAGGQSAPGAVPGLDPQLLRDLAALDAAQREVVGTQRGAAGLPAGTRDPGSPEQWLGLEQSPTRAGGAGGIGAMYEGYDKVESSQNGGGEISFSSGDQPESGNSPYYETTKPKQAPSAYVVNQGVVIPAVLSSAIDTRNPGQIMAVVSRTIYDSRSHRIPLIPQGSRLIGSFGTQVEPGVDRVPGTFSRLVFPNGDAIDLQSAQASSLDGSIGIQGRYRSNIARAVGPAFVVAALGQWVDKQFPEETITNTNGTTYETPSVMQQVSPKLSEAVTNRYAAAAPYFTVKPGQEVRIILTQDIEIPTGGVK